MRHREKVSIWLRWISRLLANVFSVSFCRSQVSSGIVKWNLTSLSLSKKLLAQWITGLVFPLSENDGDDDDMKWKGKEYEDLRNVNEEQLWASGYYEAKKARKHQQKAAEKEVRRGESNLEGTWVGTQNIEIIAERQGCWQLRAGGAPRGCCRGNSSRRGSPGVLKNTGNQAVCDLSQMCLWTSGIMANKMNSAHTHLLCAQFPVIRPLKCCLLY